MKKSKIVTIVHTGERDFDGRKGQQFTVFFENGDAGQMEVWGNSPTPKVGEEIEYETSEYQGQKRFKIKKAAYSGGGGGKQWSTEQIAQHDAIELTSSYIQSGGDLKFWKQFFVEAKSFMVEQITASGSPVANKETPTSTEDKIPF